MELNQNIIEVDIKVQDSYRQLLSQLGIGAAQLQCVMLGDSDIDYELGPNVATKNRILSAPYSIPAIKFPLIFNGAGKGLSGNITTFARQVNSDGTVSGIYAYPPTLTFTISQVPPTLANGYNWTNLTFTTAKMGFILYFQSILAYYQNISGVQEKLIESYTITVTFNGSSTLPANWEIIYDTTDNSMLIAKNAVSLIGNPNGLITVVGNISKMTSTINFNY